MKTFVPFPHRILLLAALLSPALTGCGDHSLPPTRIDGPVVRGSVTNGNGQPASNAAVLVMTRSGHDTPTTTDATGNFRATLNAGDQVTSVAAAAFNQVGFATPVVGEPTIVRMVAGNPRTDRDQDRGLNPQIDYSFAVFDTDSHGDVRFRYQFAFRYFTCVNWLPSNLGYSSNPNTWTSWALTDFPAPWQGRKLLVPTRLRWFHNLFYGFPIDRSLFMIVAR